LRYHSFVLTLVVVCLFATPVSTAMTAPAGAYDDLDLKFERGKVSVVGVRPGRFDKPTTLRRFRGRFEARVLQRKKILETIQFDFPLLGAAESEDVDPEHRALADKFRAGLTTTATVRVPLYEGADAIEIYDAQTRKTVAVDLKAPPAGASTGAAAHAP
jgi:hypothetical protein